MLYPSTLADATQWIPSSVGSNVLFHRSALIVRFEPSASQATRQAAVDSIAGSVIGGYASGGGPDGFYYVSVPTDTIVSADSAAVIVRAAADKLNSLSQVRLAIPYYVLNTNDLAYQRPRDAGDWARWQIDPSKTGSERNWVLELMNLPYA